MRGVAALNVVVDELYHLVPQLTRNAMKLNSEPVAQELDVANVHKESLWMT